MGSERGELSDPAAGGPLVDLTLPDGQEVRAVVHQRRREQDGNWWYEVAISLYSRTELADGRVVAEPTAVRCWAPATVCTPIEGQHYADVPTASAEVAPAWLIEDRAAEDLVVVHRGDCAVRSGVTRAATTEAVRQAARAGAVPCPTCRPDRALPAT